MSNQIEMERLMQSREFLEWASHPLFSVDRRATSPNVILAKLHEIITEDKQLPLLTIK